MDILIIHIMGIGGTIIIRAGIQMFVMKQEMDVFPPVVVLLTPSIIEHTTVTGVIQLPYIDNAIHIVHHAITTTIIIVIHVTLPIRNGSEQTRAIHIAQEMGQVMEDQWVNII